MMDITYIRTWEGCVYLATVLDGCTKSEAGYAMAPHMKTSLVRDAFRMVSERGFFQPGVTIAHSDRGSQYVSAEFRRHLAGAGVRQSVGRVGSCYDNAAAESLNAIIKRECTNLHVFTTRDIAIHQIAERLDNHYNQKRLRSRLDYAAPSDRLSELEEPVAA